MKETWDLWTLQNGVEAFVVDNMNQHGAVVMDSWEETLKSNSFPVISELKDCSVTCASTKEFQYATGYSIYN